MKEESTVSDAPDKDEGLDGASGQGNVHGGTQSQDFPDRHAKPLSAKLADLLREDAVAHGAETEDVAEWSRAREAYSEDMQAAAAPKQDTQQHRAGSFEDIGTQHQAAWYEVASGTPLIHADTQTHIFLHSVNRFHASSIESARAMAFLTRPAVLALQLPNNERPGAEDAIRARLALSTGSKHLQRIADGYQRICVGSTEPSEYNPNEAALRASHAEGRQLARLYHLLDLDNDIEGLVAEQPELAEELSSLRAQQPPELLQEDVWYAMFLSGMLPMDHFDKPFMDAVRIGRPVEFVDMPMSDYFECAQSIYPEDEDEMEKVDMEERTAFSEVLTAVGQQMLPGNVPETVVDLMAQAVIFPGQMDDVLGQIAERAPRTFEMAKVKAAYCARSLWELAERSPVVASSENKHVLCLVERFQEPLIRAHWRELQGVAPGTEEAMQSESMVHNMNFVSKKVPSNRSIRKKRSRR